jgi:hypothetical protein
MTPPPRPPPARDPTDPAAGATAVEATRTGDYPREKPGTVAAIREACEQGMGRCDNFLRGLLAVGGRGGPVAVMINAIRFDFEDAMKAIELLVVLHVASPPPMLAASDMSAAALESGAESEARADPAAGATLPEAARTWWWAADLRPPFTPGCVSGNNDGCVRDAAGDEFADFHGHEARADVVASLLNWAAQEMASPPPPAVDADAERVAGIAAREGFYIRGGDGSHWDGCHETHWDCRIRWLESQLVAAEAARGDAEERSANAEANLGNLLAVIFRDGGHRQAAIGDDKRALVEATDALAGLRDALGRISTIAFRDKAEGFAHLQDMARDALAPSPAGGDAPATPTPEGQPIAPHRAAGEPE